MTKMKKILLSVAALVAFVPFATPANAQVVVRVGPRHHYYHHHYYHHRYYHHY